jgi:hypothetical protein
VTDPEPLDPPPNYSACRAVLIAVVLGVLVVACLALASQVPAVATWVGATTGGLRAAWQGLHWHLL